MWLPVVVPVTAGRHELTVRCAPLGDALAVRRKPRARWRTRVCDNALRFHRTMILGRAPGFAPGPPPVGLFRPAVLEWDEPALDWDVRLEGDDGVVRVRGDGTTLRCGDAEAPFAGGVAELRLPGIERWWPHTHGDPVLHDAIVLDAGGEEVTRRRVGFRSLHSPGEGVDLHVNGVPVFVRGAVWTPGETRAALTAARDAGLNLVRVVGTGAYETPEFHDLCDELGLLVWQDLMFANLDYPFSDPDFREGCRREVAHQLSVVRGRPSLAVVCGSSESEQQVAMLGLDPAMAREPFFTEDVPELLRGVDAVWVPSAPSGPGRPFRPDRGVANYFGVGGYRRPLSDVRLAGVRFASECLAIANLPDGPDRDAPGDVGADWDFADVRDHYASELYGTTDERFARAVSGEVMAEVFGEWRRAASPCAGGIVLWLRDLAPGAGWGLLDHTGTPKAALGRLAQALAPVACWTTDEGQSGYAVHVANDRPHELEATLRVALYRDRSHLVEDGTAELVVPAHGSWTGDVEELIGRFVDVSYAYRFGPPQQDLVVTTLIGADGAVLSEHARFPAGRPAEVESAEELGLEVALDAGEVVVGARRALIGARLQVPGFRSAMDGFLVPPGSIRRVALHPRSAGTDAPVGGVLTALNLHGQVTL